MDYKLAINEILDRSGKLGVAKGDLCRAGGISASTLYRWQQEDANPRWRDLNEALDRMKIFLDGKERALRDWLPAGASRQSPPLQCLPDRRFACRARLVHPR